MSEQGFERIAAGDPSLLEQVEEVVVQAHRSLYESQGKRWSKPVAYRWLHYEDPMPVQRLLEGVEKLSLSGAVFDPVAVDKACVEAARMGFSN
jgi:hypothetical protein